MELPTIVTIVVGLSGLVLGWMGKAKVSQTEAKQDGKTDGALQSDVEYIKRGVDDIRVDLRLHGQRVDGLAERVTRVEESAKQAHKRLDKIEE